MHTTNTHCKIMRFTSLQYHFALSGYFDSKQEVPFIFLTKDMTKRQI